MELVPEFPAMYIQGWNLAAEEEVESKAICPASRFTSGVPVYILGLHTHIGYNVLGYSTLLLTQDTWAVSGIHNTQPFYNPGVFYVLYL